MYKPKSVFLIIAVLLSVHAGLGHAQESEWVTVEGFAPIENVTKQEARKMAIDNARRPAPS